MATGDTADTRLRWPPASVATCAQLLLPNVFQHVQNFQRQVGVLHVKLREVGLQQGGRGFLRLQGRVFLLEAQDPAKQGPTPWSRARGGERGRAPREGSPTTSWPKTAPWSSSSPAAGGRPCSPQVYWGACSPAERPSHNPEARRSPQPAQDVGNQPWCCGQGLPHATSPRPTQRPPLSSLP